MKKMLIALGVVATAVAVNAAAFSWELSTGRINSGAGATDYSTTLAVATPTAYLFNASTVTQQSLIDAYNAGTLNLASAGSLSSATVTSDTRITATDFSSNVTANFSAYFAILYNDKLYISTETTAPYLAVGTSAFAFDSQSTASKNTFTSGTFATNGSGWYSAAAVPEPTSGLLLLLGVAGLALKRKRA